MNTESNNLFSRTLFIINFCSDRMKTGEERRFEIFAPMLTNTKKKIVEVSKLKSLKKEKKWSGDMVERELPTKFGLDPCSGF